VKLGPVLVNGRYPTLELPPPELVGRLTADEPQGAQLAEAAAFRRHRAALQSCQIDRLRKLLPLPQLTTSFRFTPALQAEDLAILASELERGIDALPEPARRRG
jgi:hypothetical protein